MSTRRAVVHRIATAAPDGTATATPVPGEPGDYPAYYAGVRDAVLGRGPNPVPPGEAVEVMAVLELALESARQGRELALDSDVRVGGEGRRRWRSTSQGAARCRSSETPTGPSSKNGRSGTMS